MGIPFLEMPFTTDVKPYWSLPRRVKHLANAFRPYGFDLWHSFHYLDDYTEPMIAYAAGAKAWVYTKKNMNWGRQAWYVRTLLAKKIAAQNTDMMDHFFKGIFSKKAVLIPRGVDALKFVPGLPPRLGLRKKFGVPAEAPAVGCAAHLVPVKGHTTLLEAAALLPGLHVMLAGNHSDAEHTEALKKKSRDLKIEERVHFLGNIEDMPHFFSEIDIVVLPTWAKWRMEGCPVALLEAMACGKACIATAIPGSSDIIEEGINGIIVPPEDAESLAAALRGLADSVEHRQRLGSMARRRVEEFYTIEREALAHEKFYLECMP